VVRPSHILDRHVHQLVATGYHSLGSAWPTVSRSGRRIASALQSRGDNRGILGRTGEIPPGALAQRPLSGSPRTVAVSCRPWCTFPLARSATNSSLRACGISRHPPTSGEEASATASLPFNASLAALISTTRTSNARTCLLQSNVPPKTSCAPSVRMSLLRPSIILSEWHSWSCTTLVESIGSYMRRSSRKVAYALLPWISGTM